MILDPIPVLDSCVPWSLKIVLLFVWMISGQANGKQNISSAFISVSTVGQAVLLQIRLVTLQGPLCWTNNFISLISQGEATVLKSLLSPFVGSSESSLQISCILGVKQLVQFHVFSCQLKEAPILTSQYFILLSYVNQGWKHHQSHHIWFFIYKLFYTFTTGRLLKKVYLVILSGYLVPLDSNYFSSGRDSHAGHVFQAFLIFVSTYIKHIAPQQYYPVLD